MKTKYILLVSLFISFVSPLLARNVELKFTIDKGKNASTFSIKANTSQNAPFKIQITREFIYPTRWSLPKVTDQKVTPVIPEQFDMIETGLTIDCQIDSVDGLIRLTGKAIITDFQELAQSLYGEHSQPIKDSTGKILLTENKAQSGTMISTMSNFQVFAKTDKEYKFRIKHLKKWIPCRVICTYTR